MKSRPDWWDEIEEGDEYMSKWTPHHPKTEDHRNRYRFTAPPRYRTYEPKQYVEPLPQPNSAALFGCLAWICAISIIPIAGVRAGDWNKLFLWFLFLGLPFIIGCIDGLSSKSKSEGKKEECGPSESAPTVEQSQPLEQLRQRLSR